MSEPVPAIEPPKTDPSAARLADLTAMTHLGFVAFVVWVEVFVVVGAIIGWEWVREPVLRCIHFGLVAYVGVQDIIGKICPLTIWENRLREKARQTRSDRSFIGRVVHSLLMCDLDEWTLRRIRLIFAAIVTVTFFVVWPRFS